MNKKSYDTKENGHERVTLTGEINIRYISHVD